MLRILAARAVVLRYGATVVLLTPEADVQLPLMGPDFQERMQRAAHSGDDVMFRQEARKMAFSVASRCAHSIDSFCCMLLPLSLLFDCMWQAS